MNVGHGLVGPYFTRNQLAGRVQFIWWINHGRRKALVAKLNSIPWSKVAKNAAKLGLVDAKKRLVKPEALELEHS